MNALRVFLYLRRKNGADCANQYYGACLTLMDDELKDELEKKLLPCTSEFFLEEYCRSHKEKFNEDFHV